MQFYKYTTLWLLALAGLAGTSLLFFTAEIMEQEQVVSSESFSDGNKSLPYLNGGLGSEGDTDGHHQFNHGFHLLYPLSANKEKNAIPFLPHFIIALYLLYQRLIFYHLGRSVKIRFLIHNFFKH